MSDSEGGSGESFFGLIVKPNKRYDTTVQKGFRLTKACIEPATLGAADKVTSLYLEYDSDEFIISNLYKGHLSETLDLLFNLGEQISFKVDGPGTIHLTGNTIDEDEPPGFMGDFDDEEEDDEEEEDEEMESVDPKTVKRKLKDLKNQSKKIKLDSSNGKADDEESSSDEDQTGAETTTLSDLDDTTNFAEEEDSDESDDEDGEEEEEEDDSEGDDSDEEADSDEEVVESPKKPAKVNGDVSPSKKAKLEAKSPKQKAVETPKADKSKKEAGTPKANKTPKAEVKTPKPEGKTPKADKTPKQEVKTPKGEKTPKGDAAKTPKEVKTPKADAKLLKEKTDTPKSVKKLAGGMKIEDVKEGTGAEVKKGRKIGMYYAGRLQSNNKQFDSCTQGKPFNFKLGVGEVIQGWDVGIQGMKVGGKRKLIIPPAMGYGSQGAPPDIPPNSTLVFDIECKYVN